MKGILRETANNRSTDDPTFEVILAEQEALGPLRPVTTHDGEIIRRNLANHPSVPVIVADEGGGVYMIIYPREVGGPGARVKLPDSRAPELVR